MRSTALSAFLAVLLAVFVVSGVAAQEGNDEEESSDIIAPGNIDIALSGGLGGLIYPHITPTVDVGVLPLGSVVLSAGGSVDFGYCVFCSVVTAAGDWSVRSYYFTVLGRALFHLEDLSKSTGSSTALDPYGGIVAGPRFYRFAIEYDPTDDSADATINTIMIGPNVGARLLLGDAKRFFFYGELQYLLELGFQETEIELSGETYDVTRDRYQSGGFDFSIGLGVRL
ncbi:MAG: hypothetical protein R6V29_05265 [Spirochaetia bacterium]